MALGSIESAVLLDRRWTDVMQLSCIVEVVPGRDPLPFIAEYAAFVFLGEDCNSDGDASSRFDREWTFLLHDNRRSLAEFEVLCPEESGRTDGVIVVNATAMQVARCAAYLTALRAGGRIREGGTEMALSELGKAIPKLVRRLALADEWHQRMLDER